MTVENPNVKGIWTTIEVDKDGVETVLVVETDLTGRRRLSAAIWCSWPGITAPLASAGTATSI
jgi:hypothetical protein